jgi:DNA-binding PadR family transcriptional regulator
MGKPLYLSNVEMMVILALLRLGEDSYGVPISRELEQRSGRHVAIASVYATLERLEQKGIVTSRLGEPSSERGGRAKKYFSVTGKGVRAVRETQQCLQKLWHGLPQLKEAPL